MGANLSDQQGQSGGHGITVVNPTPEQVDPTSKFDLPPRVLPILSLDFPPIDPQRHKREDQIDPKPWIDFVSTIDNFAISRAELVAARQSRLKEKIVLTESLVQNFTDLYVNDKHKALAKLNDDFKKIEDLEKSLQKCTTQSKLCVDMLTKLNFLLPAEHKLEPLES